MANGTLKASTGMGDVGEQRKEVIVGEGILFLIIIVIAVIVYRWYMKSKFSKAMGIPLSALDKCRVGKSARNYPTGQLELRYPEWEAANNDGTRDRRTNNMRRIKAVSELRIGNWKVRSKSPIKLYGAVTALRGAGHDVDLIPQEMTKLHTASISYQARQASSVADLVRAFYRKPNGMFSDFCASACAKNGYVTVIDDKKPGFDFYAYFNHVGGLVACSCVNVGSNVGVGALRALSDANVLEQKPEMMFITTGGYSSQARSFAASQNIHLIDGNQLLGMVQTAWGSDPSATNISYAEYTLDYTELAAGFPSDMKPY